MNLGICWVAKDPSVWSFTTVIRRPICWSTMKWDSLRHGAVTQLVHEYSCASLLFVVGSADFILFVKRRLQCQDHDHLHEWGSNRVCLAKETSDQITQFYLSPMVKTFGYWTKNALAHTSCRLSFPHRLAGLTPTTPYKVTKKIQIPNLIPNLHEFMAGISS